jgi:hypothetical protein
VILDRENHVAAALAIAGTGNLLATDVIDLGADRDIGTGTDLYFYHTLNTAAPAGGTSIEFQTITSDDPTFATGVTVTDTTGAILLAALPINFLLFRRVQKAAFGAKYDRYLTTRLVRVGTFTGAATWNCGITYDVTDFRQFYNAPYFT